MDEDNTSWNKRDRRRHGMASKLVHISEMFQHNRDMHYREMLHTLQSTLSSLHSGHNAEFLEQVTDCYETRDKDLLRLSIWRDYQVQRVLHEYESNVQAAEEDHDRMVVLVKKKLVDRLESQRRRLKEDRALLDVANGFSLFLAPLGQVSAATHHTRNSRHMSPTKTHSHVDLAGSAGSGNGHSTSLSLLAPHSPMNSDRRSLRRRQEAHLDRDAYDDMSGLSVGTGSHMAQARRHRQGNLTDKQSDVDLPSDRDTLEEVLLGRDLYTAPSTRHSSRAYHGVTPLKSDEAAHDLGLIRTAMRRR